MPLKDLQNAPRCGAKTRAGGSCRQPAMANGRCKMHRGGAKTGIAAANYRHGRYSKVLPARMVERYNAAITDPELLNLSAEIAVVDSRLSDLLIRVESGDAGEIWDKLVKARQRYADASLKADIPEMGAQLDAMCALIDRGAADVAAWREIHGVLEQRRRLVESERKRLVEQEQMLTLHEAQTMFMAMANAVKANVSDTDTLARIQAEWTRLTGQSGSAKLPAGH